MSRPAQPPPDWFGKPNPFAIKASRDDGEIGARSRTELEQLVRVYEAMLAEGVSRDHVAGILAVLRWVLGERVPAPASGCLPAGVRPDAAEMDREDQAIEPLVRQWRATGRSRAYWAGAEHALLWVRGQVHDRPLLDRATPG